MKTLTIAILAATLFAGISLTGCETAHTETDKPTLLGGQKHEESTTYTNPITGESTSDKKTEKTGM